MCYGGGLAERNYQYGIVCSLRIREATSSPKEKEAYLYMTEATEYIRIYVDLNLLV